MDKAETPVGDKLILRGHEISWQKKAWAEILVDVDAWMDLQEAGNYDELSDTTSYTDVYRIVKEVVEGPPKNLLEAIAQEIAYRTLAGHPCISAIRVKVGKPHVSVDYLSVEILKYMKV